MSVIIKDKETEYALQMLARHQMIKKLLSDIMIDIQICDLNGWDKTEYIRMIQLLPSSYNQLRTVNMNYEVLRNMYHSRKNHKLDEWHAFCDWVETLPYAKESICVD